MTLPEILGKYRARFRKLKQGNTVYGKAPHKPVLLLAVIAQIEKGAITDNRIYLTPELVAAFIDSFQILVTSGNRPEFTLPFYHLTGEGFWHFQLQEGQILRGYVKSIQTLNEVIDFAYLDAPLFDLLQRADSREVLKKDVLDAYFPLMKDLFQTKAVASNAYLAAMEHLILNEPLTTYQNTPSVLDEEDRFVRGSLFKKWIPKLYNHTCSISRMRVVATQGYQLIDACHIRPLSISNDDTVSNGFALCPNLHRAFDRGLIGVNADYRIVVSRYLTEDEDNAYSLKALAGQSLYLPMAVGQLPLVENFVWHLGARFEK